MYSTKHIILGAIKPRNRIHPQCGKWRVNRFAWQGIALLARAILGRLFSSRRESAYANIVITSNAQRESQVDAIILTAPDLVYGSSPLLQAVYTESLCNRNQRYSNS